MDILFCDYDFVGFDLDCTLCEYHVSDMARMEYDVMADFLIGRGYPSDKLKLGLDGFGLDFIQRGLILDFQRGNVLKLDRNGGIMKATHGTKVLDPEVTVEVYGRRTTNCPFLARIKENMLSAWEPDCRSRYRLLLDYFDFPAGLAFARCVDHFDERGETDFTKCGEDTLAVLRYMYNRDHFADGRSEYFKRMRAEPGKYIRRSDPRLIVWLRNLHRKKRTFLITGSNCDLADFVATHSLGPDWRDLFDVVVCFANKPFFFTERRPYLSVTNDLKEGQPTENLSLPGIFSQGNWADLAHLFCVNLNKPEARGLYFGDNLVQDVFTPLKFGCCDTVAVVEEKNEDHPSREAVHSEFWGAMHARGSWWGNVIEIYAKASIPSMNALPR